MRLDPCPITRPLCRAGAAHPAAALVLLAALGLATGPLAAATAQPAAAASANQAKPTAAKANAKVKPKSGGTAPGDECGATSGVKVPSWPKCPGPDKVGAKVKQAGS